MGLEHFILTLTTCSVPVPSHSTVSVLYRLSPVLCAMKRVYSVFILALVPYLYFENILYFEILPPYRLIDYVFSFLFNYYISSTQNFWYEIEGDWIRKSIMGRYSVLSRPSLLVTQNYLIYLTIWLLMHVIYCIIYLQVLIAFGYIFSDRCILIDCL